MSERYSKVFALSENLYATGSPIVIEAGALQKDNQTGSVLAQIKMKNISAKVIKAVKVKLTLFDVASNVLADGVEQQYLDLKVVRDESFGSKSAIRLKESTTRSFAVNIIEVVFEDGSVWSGTANPWETLGEPTTLIDYFNDDELVKQFELKYGSPCHNVLLEEKDLWYCTCGAINKDNEAKCHKCGKSLKALKELDISALQSEKEKRLEEERILAEEQAERKRKEAEIAKIKADAKKKRTKKVAAIVTPIVAVLAVVFMLVYNMILVPNSKYNDAVALMDNGQYEEALAVFEVLNGYKDSEDYVELCSKEIQYGEALFLMSEGKYEDAVVVFESLNGYRDSKEKIEFCNQNIQYDKAVVLFDSGMYDKAVEAFSALGNYKEAVNKAKIAKTMEEKILPIYNKAGINVSFGDYQWTIAQKRGNKVQLITKDSVTTMALNKRAVDKSNWKSSDAYKWLNGTFYNKFTADEKYAIIAETDGDMVTLLKEQEALRMSPYYSSSTGTVRSNSKWWLLPEKETSWPSHVYADGSVGCSVTCTSPLGIRPVIWVDLVRLAEVECGIK